MKIKSFFFCFLLLLLVPPATGQVFTPQVVKRSPEELARRSAYGFAPLFIFVMKRDESSTLKKPRRLGPIAPERPVVPAMTTIS